MSMTVTYTKEVGLCGDCPNYVHLGAYKAAVIGLGSMCTLTKTPVEQLLPPPSSCPLRPAPGEEWEPASRSMPRIDSDEWDASVRVWTLDNKGHVNEDVYERRGGGRFSYHEGARERFSIKTIIVAWRYRRSPAPPTGE